MTRPRLAVIVATLVTAALVGACGEDATDTTDGTTTTSSIPTSTSGASTTTSVSTSTTESPIDSLVLSGDGLGVVDFGDEAEGALVVLVEILGSPHIDTGWGDPSDSANEPLWPGCPGTVARIVVWEGMMGVRFTDWDQSADDPRASLDAPYLAGAGLRPDSPITTPDGARSGDTVGRLRAIYGDRLSIAYTEDGPLPAAFAIDGTAGNGTLDRTGGLRGNIQADIDTDESVAVAFTAGVSCDSP